jgi:hypothetical protein
MGYRNRGIRGRYLLVESRLEEVQLTIGRLKAHEGDI